MGIISELFFAISTLLIIYLLYALFKQREVVKSVGIVTGCVVALSSAFYSIYSSNMTLKNAERLTMIQTRPYICLEGVNFIVHSDMRNNVEKRCEYAILLKNRGNIPASDVVMDLDIYFKSKNGAIFEISTYKRGTNAVNIPSDKTPFVVASGDLSRVKTGRLWINKEDADPIADGSKAIGFNIILAYSAPGYSNRWTYSVNGELFNGVFQIKNEKIS